MPSTPLPPPTPFSSDLLPMDANASHHLCRQLLRRRRRHSLQIYYLWTLTPLNAYVVNSSAAAAAILFRSVANCRTPTLLTAIAVVSTADAPPPPLPSSDKAHFGVASIIGVIDSVQRYGPNLKALMMMDFIVFHPIGRECAKKEKNLIVPTVADLQLPDDIEWSFIGNL
nr:hypothetical protein Iba_chr11bCG12890 [Ipomoea batatas]